MSVLKIDNFFRFTEKKDKQKSEALILILNKSINAFGQTRLIQVKFGLTVDF